MGLPRRRVLSLLGGVATAALAGCQAPAGDDGGTGRPSPTFAGDPLGPYEVPDAVRRVAADDTSGAVQVAATTDAVLLSTAGHQPQSFGVGDPPEYVPGHAEVIERDGGSWAARHTLSRPDGRLYFGSDTAMADDSALVGAPGYDSRRGAGLVYGRTRDGGWERTATLTPSDIPSDASLGWTVALSGETALVHGRRREGSDWVAVFERDSGDWGRRATLGRSGVATRFGTELALDGDVAVVGAPTTTVNGLSGAGAAHVYERAWDSWRHRTRLTAPEPIRDGAFGSAVAVDGQRVVVGGPASPAAPQPTSLGEQFVFEPDGAGRYDHAGTMYPSPRAVTGDVSLALDGDVAFVGAYEASVAGLGRTGAVSRFERTGEFWERTGVLVPPTAATSRLGSSVAHAPGVTVAGGVHAPESGESRAAAYVYEDAAPDDDTA